MKYEIQPLSKEVVSAYIDHHMKFAGTKMPIFTEAAIEAIALRSQGWLRVKNTLTVNSFWFSAKKGSRIKLMRKS